MATITAINPDGTLDIIHRDPGLGPGSVIELQGETFTIVEILQGSYGGGSHRCTVRVFPGRVSLTTIIDRDRAERVLDALLARGWHIRQRLPARTGFRRVVHRQKRRH